MLVISRFSFVLFCALGVFVCKSFTSFLARFISIFNFKNNRKRFRNTIGGIYYFVISSLTSLMYLEEGISRFGISYISFSFPYSIWVQKEKFTCLPTLPFTLSSSSGYLMSKLLMSYQLPFLFLSFVFLYFRSFLGYTRYAIYNIQMIRVVGNCESIKYLRLAYYPFLIFFIFFPYALSHSFS